MNRNKLYNTKNPAQGEYKKVLCLCSAGLLRSPTTALVLSQEPFNYNTRAAGVVSDYALITVDGYLVSWADEVVVMTQEHKAVMEAAGCDKPIVCLDIPDEFSYRDPELMKMIAERYTELTKSKETSQP